MRASSYTGRTFWVGVALLLGGVAFLAFRSGEAVTAVLDAGRKSFDGGPGAAPANARALRVWTVRDSLLASSILGERDPFRAPNISKVYSGAPAPRTEDREVPSVGALLYDNVNPSVQIRVGGTTSGWLREGDEFRGWVVDEITPTSVKITRGVQTVVLPSS